MYGMIQSMVDNQRITRFVCDIEYDCTDAKHAEELTDLIQYMQSMYTTDIQSGTGKCL